MNFFEQQRGQRCHIFAVYTCCFIHTNSLRFIGSATDVNINTISTDTAWVSNRLWLCYFSQNNIYIFFTWMLYKFVGMGLDETSQKILRSEPPSLESQCWRRAEAILRCMTQPARAEQRWWSCSSRPMHRPMWRTRKAGGLSSDGTRSGSSWRATACLEIGIHRIHQSFQQKGHFVKTGVHIFPVLK